MAGEARILALNLVTREVEFTIEQAGIITNMVADPRVGRVYWGTEIAGDLVVGDLATHAITNVIDIDPNFYFEFDVPGVGLSANPKFAYATGPRGLSVVNLQTTSAIVIDITGAVLGLTVADCPSSVPPPPTATPTPEPIACVGDCNGNGKVTADDVLTMVRIALGDGMVGVCPAGDASRKDAISVDEILTAVLHARSGCRDCRDGVCIPGSTCACCCGAWQCLPPETICCDLACSA